VLMPWNLGLWWQLRRLRVGLELDCDARVAPRVADRPRYGQLLLQARARQRTYHAALAFVPSPSVLAERLYALLESARLSRVQMARWSSSALACVLILTRVPVPSVAALVQRAPQHARPRGGQLDAKSPVTGSDVATITTMPSPTVSVDARRSPIGRGELMRMDSANTGTPSAPVTSTPAEESGAARGVPELTLNGGVVAVGENMPTDGFGIRQAPRDTNSGLSSGRVGGGGRGGRGGGAGGFASGAFTFGGGGASAPPGGATAAPRVVPDSLLPRRDSSSVLRGSSGIVMRARPDSGQY